MRRPWEIPGWLALGAGLAAPPAWWLSHSATWASYHGGTLATQLGFHDHALRRAAGDALLCGLVLGVACALGRGLWIGRWLRRQWFGPATRSTWMELLRGALLATPLILATLELGWILHDHVASARIQALEHAVEAHFPLIEPCGAVGITLPAVCWFLAVAARLERRQSPIRSRRRAHALLAAAFSMVLVAAWFALHLHRFGSAT